jgi:ribonuclease P protein component
VAYAVGKQVGGAVARNRLRRRLRAVVREIAPELSSGAYLVTAGREAAGISHEELKTQVTAAMTAAAEARRR